MSRPDPATTLLGRRLRLPLGIAPMAHHRLFHPEGETATARGAGAVGALFVASIFANRTLEEIAGHSAGPLWLQLYWLRRRDQLEKLVARAEEAGFRNGFTVPRQVRAVNLDEAVTAGVHRATTGVSALAAHSEEQFDTTITWRDLEWLRGRTGLPLVLKGILTAQDAVRAVEHGVDGVVVSNHGGRQLPGSPRPWPAGAPSSSTGRSARAATSSRPSCSARTPCSSAVPPCGG